MESDIDLLKTQVMFAHERIERLTKENLEFRMLIESLLLSHHDKEVLAKKIEATKELIVAIGLGAPLSDAYLQFLQEKAARAISLVRPPSIGNT